MNAMAELDDLHEQILRELDRGRCTPRYLAGETEESRQLVSSRLQDLTMANYVVKIDRGLYEITDRGEQRVGSDD